MKYIVYITIILINLNSCKAQNKIKMEQDIMIPKITDGFEKFDLDKYVFEKENSFVLEDEKLIKRMSQSFGYAKHIVFPLSYFSIIKLYYKNRNIKEKGVSFNNGSEYGIWYEYDENGKLINTTDTDEGYDFSWKDIIRYCEKNEIPLTKGHKEFAGFQTRIIKNETGGGKGMGDYIPNLRDRVVENKSRP